MVMVVDVIKVMVTVVNVMVNMVRHDFGHDVVSVAAVGRASDRDALGGVVDQLLCMDGRALLEECVSARGVVDMTRAVSHNVEVRRMI